MESNIIIAEGDTVNGQDIIVVSPATSRRKTKLEIIDETVAYYSQDTNRRSMDEGGNCKYFGPDGNRCAYARCWNERITHIREGLPPTELIMPEPDHLVKEEYKGHDRAFWRDIQDLHDNSTYWNPFGLTEDGKSKVASLKSLYID